MLRETKSNFKIVSLCMLIGIWHQAHGYTHSVEFGPTFMFMPGEYHLTFDLVAWYDINVDFKVNNEPDLWIDKVEAKSCDAWVGGANFIGAQTVGWLVRAIVITCKSLASWIPEKSLVGKSLRIPTPGSMAEDKDFFIGVTSDLKSFTSDRSQDMKIAPVLINAAEPPPEVLAKNPWLQKRQEKKPVPTIPLVQDVLKELAKTPTGQTAVTPSKPAVPAVTAQQTVSVATPSKSGESAKSAATAKSGETAKPTDSAPQVPQQVTAATLSKPTAPAVTAQQPVSTGSASQAPQQPVATGAPAQQPGAGTSASTTQVIQQPTGVVH